MTTQFDTGPGMAEAVERHDLDWLLTQVLARLDAIAGATSPPDFDVPETSALFRIGLIFGLSKLEMELLALAVACDISDAVGQKAVELAGSTGTGIAIALRFFGNELWNLICPEAPLRKWRLIELTGSGPLRQLDIRVDERIIQALLGNVYVDERLSGLLDPIELDAMAAPSATFRSAVEAINSNFSNEAPVPVILLGGPDRRAQRNVLVEVAAKFNLSLLRLRAGDIPQDWSQRNTLSVLVDRELALSGAMLIVETMPEDAERATDLVDRLTGPVAILADDPPLPERTPRLRLDLAPAGLHTQQEIWRTALGEKNTAFLGPAVDVLAGQFTLDPASVHSAVALVGDPAPKARVGEYSSALWNAARFQGRRALNGLAERIESRADWDDLVVPESLLAILRDISAQVRDGWRVNHVWGWAEKNPRGLGTAALFAGPSGTGKTLAAEVLANDLSLDLYRVDLSQVVSKYIGETEKNLARIFAAAEDGGAVLLFDEADALFGKRSEVKDSHDRYANVEVSYLLQKMEAYRGLAILTTNQRSALDTAFLRRLRYVVSFPFPDAATRLAIWKGVFPVQTPLEKLDFGALAGLSLSGGSIRSIALNAAFLAAGAGSPVTMDHVRRAAMREYAKLEKPLTAVEKGSLV